jgi:UDP-N-acetylglucosamine 4,6-dehydratase
MLAQHQLNLNDRTILVTGGTGSFGQRFVQYVVENYKPKRIVVFSRDEGKHYDMSAKLSTQEYGCLRYFIGDVRDVERLRMAMNGIELVVHAAALKQVPIAEYNPFECISTNTYGTENVIRAAMYCGVRKVLGVSTDKAVAPVNLYGATKLAAEKLMVAANNLSGASGTRFAVARYGNVVGSRGSVVPFFRQLIAQGASHLPITDPRMTRFWITLSGGVEFVLTSLSMMHGGEIFIPKLQTMRVVDLAKAMAPRLPHKVIGIRPGEKIHETLISADEARSTLELDDRYLIEPPLALWEDNSPNQFAGRRVPQDFVFTSSDERLLMSDAKMREFVA